MRAYLQGLLGLHHGFGFRIVVLGLQSFRASGSWSIPGCIALSVQGLFLR